MLSFKNYILTEASLNYDKNLVKTITKHVTKSLGKPFRWGGKNGIQEISMGGGSGAGILLIFGNKRAMRMNFNGKKLDSISVWGKYKFDTEPTTTIEVGNVDITTRLDRLTSVIENPKKTKFTERIEFKKIDGDGNSEYRLSIKRGDSRGIKLPKLTKRSKLAKKELEAVAIVDPDKAVDPTSAKFDNLKKLLTYVSKGRGKSLFIYGGPGTGKSFTTMDILKSTGRTKNKDFIVVKGKVTPMALYTTLYMNREENKLIVFDDADSAFKGQDSANILKAALDSYDTRTISWVSSATKNVQSMSPAAREEYQAELDDDLKSNKSKTDMKLPSEFDYKGKIVFISNLKEKDVDSAIMSRSFKIDMTLSDEEILGRIEGIVQHIGDDDIPVEKKMEVLNVLKQKVRGGEIQHVNMRTFVAALDLYASGIPDWYNLISYS